MMTAHKWILLLLTGLGGSATLDAQILGLGDTGNGEASSLVTTPGETLPVNIDPFAEIPAEAQTNEPLIGLDNSAADRSYSIELADEPELIIKQHSLNPLIDLSEDSKPATSADGELPTLDFPLE